MTFASQVTNFTSSSLTSLGEGLLSSLEDIVSLKIVRQNIGNFLLVEKTEKKLNTAISSFELPISTLNVDFKAVLIILNW